MRRRDFLGSAAALAAFNGKARADNVSPLLITMTTCRRPGGVSYLEQTLARLDPDVFAVPAMRVIFWDGETPNVERHGWRNVALPPRPLRPGGVDNKTSGWGPIRMAAEMGADLLFLEDDIAPVRAGAIAEMLRYRVPAGCAWTSFFHRLRPSATYPASAFDMSQAVKMPAATVRVLSTFPLEHPGDWDGPNTVDIAMAAAGLIHGWRYELTPALVRHVGIISAVAPQPKEI